MNKKIVLILGLLLGVSFVTNAQIYSDEALFYVEAGKSLLNDPYVKVIIVDNEANKIFMTSTRVSYIEEDGFQKYDNPNYVRNCLKKGATVYEYSFNPSLSKKGKEVYEYYSYGRLTFYIVFSDDKSSFVHINRNQKDKKTTFIRIKRDKLKPQDDSNDDFLYD